MPDIKTPASLKEMPLSIVNNMVTLATSGFGVVVALAWNEVIQKAVAEYIDPYLGKNSGMISLLIYAIAMTVLAVLITTQLSAVQRKLEALNEKVLKKNNRDQKAA
ncbi:MAG TPA: DUF5654 family protein [Vitreimonas sp.]|nr:DUF5654 family protein [Vitreimonas sp.]